MIDPVADFADFMAKHGLHPQKVVDDGRMHRFSTDGKHGKDNGWYKLVNEGPYHWGAFGDWAAGLKKNWVSKRKNEMTPIDREAVEARRQDQARADLKKKAEAAKRAQHIWFAATQHAPHDYVDRKKIVPYGVRYHKDALVVPVRVGGELTSLQFIKPDGTKKFLRHGDPVGGYCAIGSPHHIMFICEGYATGCSLHMATQIPVAVAFNAGNLLPVAENIQRKYSGTRIIIVADNDQWTERPNGEAWNPGLESARAAAQKLGLEVLHPGFPPDHPARPTDFNDLHVLNGMMALQEALSDAGIRQAGYCGSSPANPRSSLAAGITAASPSA